MARRFTAANAADLITFTLTSQLAAIPTGALCFGVAWRPRSSHRGGIVKVTQSGSVQVGCNPFDGAGHLFFSVSGSGNDAGDYTADINNYRQDWFTKAAGNGVQMRHHRNQYASPGWVHTNIGTASAGGTANEDIIAGLFASGQWADLDLAVMGFYATDLGQGVDPANADAAIEAADLMSTFQAWRDLATPAGLWPCNQDDPTDPIPDESGNGATGTATGTTITDDPPGFSFVNTAEATLDLVGPAATLAADAASRSAATLITAATAAVFAAAAAAASEAALMATSLAASLTLAGESNSEATLTAVGPAAALTAAAISGGTVVPRPSIGTVLRPDDGLIHVPRLEYP